MKSIFLTRARELAEEGAVLRRAGPVGESVGLDHEAVRIGVCFGGGDDGMRIGVPQEVGTVLPFEGVVATAIIERYIEFCQCYPKMNSMNALVTETYIPVSLMCSTGSKWSSLNAPGTETPQSHP